MQLLKVMATASAAIALGAFSDLAVAQCPLTPESTFAHAEIGPVKIFRDMSSNDISFASQMQVNTDGARHITDFQ
ncbi:MAG: hypothetical protein L6Q65_17510 [Zoogloea sp.]|nr:hypothetical protein [Zoogloea sp.]